MRAGHKEGWALKNWCFRTVVLVKTLESPLDSKETKPVNPKGNQSWTFTGKTDAEAEALILWSPDVKSQLIGKDPDIGKIEGRRRRGHWLNGHEFEQTPGNSEGQGSWHSTAHGVPGSRAWLSNYTTTTVTTPAQVGLVASLPPLIMFLHSLDKHFLNSWFALGQTKLIHNMTLTVIYHWLMLNTKHSRCCSKNFLIVISFNPHIKTQWVNSRIISILQMRKQRWNNSLRVT